MISYITLKDLNELGGTYEDTETCIDRLRTIKGVEVACMVKEADIEVFKVSLRSKTYADVSVAASVLNGGGHKMASGCTLYTDLETAIEKLKKEIIKIL